MYGNAVLLWYENVLLKEPQSFIFSSRSWYSLTHHLLKNYEIQFRKVISYVYVCFMYAKTWTIRCTYLLNHNKHPFDHIFGLVRPNLIIFELRLRFVITKRKRISKLKYVLFKLECCRTDRRTFVSDLFGSQKRFRITLETSTLLVTNVKA